MKIHKIQGDISKEILNTIKNTCSIDCEMQGLVPRRDQLSLIQLTSDNFKNFSFCKNGCSFSRILS